MTSIGWSYMVNSWLRLYILTIWVGYSWNGYACFLKFLNWITFRPKRLAKMEQKRACGVPVCLEPLMTHWPRLVSLGYALGVPSVDLHAARGHSCLSMSNSSCHSSLLPSKPEARHGGAGSPWVAMHRLFCSIRGGPKSMDDLNLGD